MSKLSASKTVTTRASSEQPKSPGKVPGAEQAQNPAEGGRGTGADRRSFLIQILIDHHLEGNPYKLKLKQLADRAGISRQALDRYYGDLKPYLTGRRNIADLVSGEDQKIKIEAQALLNESAEKHAQEIENLKIRHQKEMQKALDSHITSLMNNDILMYESTKIRTSLERQTLHTADLIKQNQTLNLQLALGAEGSATGIHLNGAPKQNKVIFDLDIEMLCSEYQKSKSIDVFEESKNAQLRKIRDKLSTYADSPNVHVVLFADRYISRFKTFAERYVSQREETCLIVRLPLFSRSEVKNVTSSLPRRFKVSIHVPYSESESEKKANRVFLLKGLVLPPEETRAADHADSPSINWGFDEVTFFRVKQGE